MAGKKGSAFDLLEDKDTPDMYELANNVAFAAELEGQLAADFLARQSEIEAFRNQSVERVMQRLGDKLKDVTIDIIPFSNDANPSTLNVKQN